MSSRAATFLFAAVLGAAILLRVWLVLALPFGQTVAGRLEGLNDEPAHYNVVRYLVEHRSFAVQTRHVAEPGAFERADFEYYQPPLYYLLCAPLVATAGERAGVMACRLVSLACGLLSLVVLSRILAQLGLRTSARRAGVVFAALLPVHAYFTSVVSNDGLCWLIALLLTRELLARARGDAGGMRAGRARQGVGADLRLGVLLGLGMLTKSALMVFYPVALIGYALIERRGPGRRVLVGALTALVVSLVIAGWWYVRNVLLYGSPFAIEVGFGPPEPGRWDPMVQAHAAAGTVRSFWFPMQHVAGTPAVVALRVVGALLVAVHASAALAFLARRVPFDAPTFVGLSLFAVVMTGYVALNLMWGESEGRFLLPALGPLVFLFVAPVFAGVATRPGGARLAWVYLIALAVHPWLFLAFA
jgi:4-amino-4-deoxy-L-arabinose transferase-like glycosyltransferase